MPYVARLPQKSWWSRQFPDGWLLAAVGLITLLGLAAFSIKLGLLVADLDQEVGQLYPLQRRVRVVEGDLAADRHLNGSKFDQLGRRVEVLRETVERNKPIQVEEKQ